MAWHSSSTLSRCLVTHCRSFSVAASSARLRSVLMVSNWCSSSTHSPSILFASWPSSIARRWAAGRVPETMSMWRSRLHSMAMTRSTEGSGPSATIAVPSSARAPSEEDSLAAIGTACIRAMELEAQAPLPPAEASPWSCGSADFSAQVRPWRTTPAPVGTIASAANSPRDKRRPRRAEAFLQLLWTGLRPELHVTQPPHLALPGAHVPRAINEKAGAREGEEACTATPLFRA
mmetsp:Transcript_6015/g.10895  ORF Transcript_6015/g.10895 Transcript_6015/m.10895 type:complete len:233 (-) Transcript_6015:254-952(-)